jgi:ribosomal protein S18 acetylase RimI-like enzyme
MAGVERLHLTLPDGRELPVRRLGPGDAETLRRFNAELGAESRRRFLPHSYDPDTLRRLLERAEAGEDYLLGAFDGDRLVGYFFLWHFRSRVPLLGIGMLDGYQGKGLGRQMMAMLIDAGREAGCEGIELTTMLDNDRAFALYQKMGFRYYGDVENVTGDGTKIVERGMFYEIKPGARLMEGPHRPPV